MLLYIAQSGKYTRNTQVLLDILGSKYDHMVKHQSRTRNVTLLAAAGWKHLMEDRKPKRPKDGGSQFQDDLLSALQSSLTLQILISTAWSFKGAPKVMDRLLSLLSPSSWRARPIRTQQVYEATAEKYTFCLGPYEIMTEWYVVLHVHVSCNSILEKALFMDTERNKKSIFLKYNYMECVHTGTNFTAEESSMMGWLWNNPGLS